MNDKSPGSQEGESKQSVHQSLNKRFDPKDIEWVIINAFDYNTKNGIVIKAFAQPYIKKEVAERTADELFGVFNWENGYDMPDGSGRIKYWIRFREDSHTKWIYRYDGASIDLDAKGNFKSEAFEIALTFAEKRCWAKVGIGRYLKLIPSMEVEISESWVEGWSQYQFRSKVEKQTWKGKEVGVRKKFYWCAPDLPDHALPEGFTYPSRNRTVSRQEDPPSNDAAKAATAQDWKDIMAYYNNLPELEQTQWDPYLFLEHVDEEGEVTKKDRKNLSKEYAQKILTSFRKGYGKLVNGVPQHPGKEPEPPKGKSSSQKGVTQKDIEDTLGAEPEKK